MPKTKSEQRKVKDLADLKRICKRTYRQFFIALNGGAKSSKGITFEDPGWYIQNEIDDTSNDYSTDRGMLKNTHIGEALEKGALYWYGF